MSAGAGPGLSAADVEERRKFIGGSDANRIMGRKPGDIERLIRVKRGEEQPEDLGDNFQVFLGTRTEEDNRDWFVRKTGRAVTRVGERAMHPTVPYLAATLDGETVAVDGSPAVFEAKHTGVGASWEELVLRWTPQLQHAMEVLNVRWAVLSVIQGNEWPGFVEVPYDAAYVEVMLRRHRTFWDCVETGARWPGLPDDEVPDPEMPARIKAARPIDVRRAASPEQWRLWRGLAERWLQVAGAARQEKAVAAEFKAAVRDGLLPPDFRTAHGAGVVLTQGARRDISVRADTERREAAPDDAGKVDFSSIDAAMATLKQEEDDADR